MHRSLLTFQTMTCFSTIPYLDIIVIIIFSKVPEVEAWGNDMEDVHLNSCLTCCRNLLSNSPLDLTSRAIWFLAWLRHFYAQLAILSPAPETMLWAQLISTQKPELPPAVAFWQKGSEKGMATQMQSPPSQHRSRERSLFSGGIDSSFSLR